LVADALKLWPKDVFRFAIKTGQVQARLLRVWRLTVDFASAKKRHEIGRLLETYWAPASTHQPCVKATAVAWPFCHRVSKT
jgi:hypothetical protein